MDNLDLLIIDDNQGILWIFDELLESEDVKYKAVQSALEGIEIIKEYKPGLVITDFKLGGSINGLDLIKRCVDLSRESKFIIMTGYSEFIKSEDVGQLNVIKVIEKPFNIIDLLAVIKTEKKKSVALN